MTPTDVVLVTLLLLIATGMWWLAAHLHEREKRETDRQAHEMQIELQRRIHALNVEEMERRSYLRRRETITQTVELGERLKLQGEHMRSLVEEIMDDPDEPWKHR